MPKRKCWFTDTLQKEFTFRACEWRHKSRSRVPVYLFNFLVTLTKVWLLLLFWMRCHLTLCHVTTFYSKIRYQFICVPGFTVTIPSTAPQFHGNLCRYFISICYRYTCRCLYFAINNFFYSLPCFPISTFIAFNSTMTLNLYNFNNNHRSFI